MPRMTGSAFFADMLQAYEVSHLFFVPTVMYPTLRELDARGIRSVMTHGEKAASYMADGYARALRKPGFCMAQNVGGANLAAGVKDAYLACSPVVAITGGPFAEYRYRHEYQEVEHFRMFDPVTKLNAVVDRIDRLPDLMRQAFRAATTGTPRPVHLEMRGHMGNVVEEEGDLELVVEAPFKGYPAFRPEAEQALVRQAARRLAQAERPMIVAGGGVTASDAGPELLALADRLGIPVATSLNAKELIPGDHPLNVGVVGTYSRWCANRLVSEADLVFFVGSHAGSQVTHHWQYPPVGTPAIQLDIDPLEIGRNYPIEIGLQGDAKATLRRLLDVAETPRARTAWHERVRAVVAEWRAETQPLRTSETLPMRPERLCEELTAWLPPSAVVVADTGHAGIWTGTMLDLNRPGQRYLRAAGSLGWGMPAALGAKCALPDRPVLCFTGDGGFYYHLAELETAARYGINAVILVNNNRSLNQDLWSCRAAFGDPYSEGARDTWMFRDLSLAQVAESLGCLGLRVERPSELGSALDQAFSANRPAVIDVVTETEALAERAHG